VDAKEREAETLFALQGPRGLWEVGIDYWRRSSMKSLNVVLSLFLALFVVPGVFAAPAGPVVARGGYHYEITPKLSAPSCALVKTRVDTLPLPLGVVKSVGVRRFALPSWTMAGRSVTSYGVVVRPAASSF
jgi:hypothetical protein